LRYNLNFLPKLSINDDEIYIPNWIVKYWEIDNELGIKNLEVEIQIVNENNIPNCESIVINKISNKIFFPTKFNNLETESNTNDTYFLKKTPLNSIKWKENLIRNANNKIIKLNSAFPIYVSAHPCLFKVLSINGDKNEKEKFYKISENTQFSFERELKLEQRCPWGLEKERQQLMDMLSYNEMELILQKQLNIQKSNGIIINGAIGVGKNEVVQDVCTALDIPIYPLSILKMNWEFMNNEDIENNTADSSNNDQIYSYLHKIVDKAKLSAPSVILISELDLLANGKSDSEIYKVSILKELEKMMEKIKDDSSIHIIGLTENRKFLPELFSKSELFSREVNIEIPNRFVYRKNKVYIYIYKILIKYFLIIIIFFLSI